MSSCHRSHRIVESRDVQCCGFESRKLYFHISLYGESSRSCELYVTPRPCRCNHDVQSSCFYWSDVEGKKNTFCSDPWLYTSSISSPSSPVLFFRQKAAARIRGSSEPQLVRREQILHSNRLSLFSEEICRTSITVTDGVWSLLLLLLLLLRNCFRKCTERERERDKGRAREAERGRQSESNWER